MRLIPVYLAKRPWPQQQFSSTLIPFSHKQLHPQQHSWTRFYSSTLAPSTQPDPRFQTQQSIEDLVSSLPLIRYLRSCTHSSSPSPTLGKPIYTEFQPLRTMHPAAQSTHLVTTSLVSNPTKLPTDPIFFLCNSPAQTNPQIIATCYISTHVTGHAGFIHGGLPFLLFDDVFARLAAELFPSRVGMTANMALDFRAPALPDRAYIYRAFVEKVEGKRKVWVRGEMRCLREFGAEEMSGRSVAVSDGVGLEEREGVLVVEARALFVEPTGAEGMVPLYPK